jgi:hypothetical protein
VRTPPFGACSSFVPVVGALMLGGCAGTTTQQARSSPGAEKPTITMDSAVARGAPAPTAPPSVASPEVIFTRDGFGASRGYKEYHGPEESQAPDGETYQPPGQPTLGLELEPPVDPDMIPTTLPTGALRNNGDWLGQPHGRVYYRASCQAARELPEPIYFESEEEAQQIGYRRSQVPGC